MLVLITLSLVRLLAQKGACWSKSERKPSPASRLEATFEEEIWNFAPTYWTSSAAEYVRSSAADVGDQ